MKRFWLLALCVAWAGTAGAAGKPVRIKLGTLAPRDSTPHQLLKAMGEQWKQASDGAVTLTVFTDGTQGGEAEMVRRMRIGQLQAGMISGTGLAEIDESIACLQTMPLVFRSLDEVDYVREQMRPMLDQRFAAKGFVMLGWVDAGWVKYFSRTPVVRPDDFKKLRMFSWAGDNRIVEIIKSFGYQPVPLETADILTSLKTGMIDVVPTPPFYALALQFYIPAPHMADVNWAPLVGGVLITKKAWDELPAATQVKLRAIAEATSKELRLQARKENEEAVAAMQKRGLTVHTPTAEIMQEWHQLAAQVYPKLRGPIVPADLFDEVQRLLAVYRAAHP